MTDQNDLDITSMELQLTIRSIVDTKATLKNDRIQHSDLVEQLKDTIKKAKADIISIQSETFPSAVEARTARAETKSAQMLDIESKRATMEKIEELKQRIATDAKIHSYKVSSLQSEVEELHLKKADALSKNKIELEKTELELQTLTEEYTKNKIVLDQLEERLRVEQLEQEEVKQQGAARLEEEVNAKAIEETKHYAALWIQLRWKTFMKRSTKGKKSKKKGAKKKKS